MLNEKMTKCQDALWERNFLTWQTERSEYWPGHVCFLTWITPLEYLKAKARATKPLQKRLTNWWLHYLSPTISPWMFKAKQIKHVYLLFRFKTSRDTVSFRALYGSIRYTSCMRDHTWLWAQGINKTQKMFSSVTYRHHNEKLYLLITQHMANVRF